MRLKLKFGSGGLLLFLIFAVAAVLAGRLPAVRAYLSEESIKAGVVSLGLWGPLVILGISLALPFLFLPRWPVVFVAGALYGMVNGTVIGVAAGTLGAIAHFALARRMFKSAGERVRKKFRLSERLDDRKAFVVIFGLRAFPLSNYGLTNLLASALGMRMLPFIGATILGMIPSTLMYAAWGKMMRKPSAGYLALAIGLVVVLTLGSWWLGKKWLPIREERSDADDSDLVGG
jgi:uncharacterized membrane protein YdjX (TVP38/TMEM64 family)